MVTDSPLAGVSVMADTMAVTAKLASSLVGDACAVSLDERSQRCSPLLQIAIGSECRALADVP